MPLSVLFHEPWQRITCPKTVWTTQHDTKMRQLMTCNKKKKLPSNNYKLVDTHSFLRNLWITWTHLEHWAVFSNSALLQDLKRYQFQHTVLHNLCWLLLLVSSSICLAEARLMIVIFQCHLFAAILKSQNDLNEKLRRKREQRRRKLEMEQAAEKEDFERKVNKMIFFLFRSLAFFFCLSSLSSSQPFCCLVTSSRNFPTGRHVTHKRCVSWCVTYSDIGYENIF